MSNLATNREAGYRYELMEKFEAGLVLSGAEVKAAKLGQVNLKGSYLSLRHVGKKVVCLLVGAHISLYKYATDSAYNPLRERELLLKKSELNYLAGKANEAGLTLIPLRLYTKNSLVKLEFAVARGKKLFDKRESIKKREVARDFNRLKRGKS
jgi:SsrA-binding protein